VAGSEKDSCGSGQEPLMGSYKHSSDTLGSIKGENCLSTEMNKD
jgi:hypothetical protein